jgi:hypothetical protein
MHPTKHDSEQLDKIILYAKPYLFITEKYYAISILIIRNFLIRSWVLFDLFLGKTKK